VSNDAPYVAEPVKEPVKEPVSSATSKSYVTSVVLASIVGFCVWSAAMGLKHLDVFTYISPEHQKLIDNPVVGTSPAAVKWQTESQKARDADALVTATGLYGAIGVVVSIALLALMAGVAGMSAKSWLHAIVGCVAFTLLCLASGVLVEWLFIQSLGLRYNEEDISHEARFLVAEIALWGLIGALLALFSSFVFGKPAPWYANLTSMATIGSLGGGVAACVAMATVLSVQSLAPNRSSIEVSALGGLACAVLFGVLVWRAFSTSKNVPIAPSH
jgi:hypothetical protein